MEQPEMHSIAIVLMIEAQVTTNNCIDIDKIKLSAKDQLVTAISNFLYNTPDITWGDVSCLSFVVDDSVSEGEA